jgi:hypothetical protein
MGLALYKKQLYYFVFLNVFICLIISDVMYGISDSINNIETLCAICIDKNEQKG